MVSAEIVAKTTRMAEVIIAHLLMTSLARSSSSSVLYALIQKSNFDSVSVVI